MNTTEYAYYIHQIPDRIDTSANKMMGKHGEDMGVGRPKVDGFTLIRQGIKYK